MNLVEHLAQYDCHLLEESTTHEELMAFEKDLPSDLHLVRYWAKSPLREQHAAAAGLPVEDMICISGIRAYKMSDIFDAFHDAGCDVLEITQGYGRIRPNLFGAQAAGGEE